MHGGLFSYALLIGLATALVVAACTDIRRREIDNELNGVIALTAPLWWLAAGYSWTDVGFQLALAAVTFAVACVLFVARQMGGGDVKLLSALALWFMPQNFLQLVVLMAILGGGASVAMAAFNMSRQPGERARDLLAALVAIAWVGATAAIVFGVVTGQPVIAPERMAAWVSAIPSLWLLAPGVLALVFIFILGFTHIMRRQKSRLPIPYGVAISAAGLWLLGERVLQATGFAGLSG